MGKIEVYEALENEIVMELANGVAYNDIDREKYVEKYGVLLYEVEFAKSSATLLLPLKE